MSPSHSGSDLLVVLPFADEADAMARQAVRDLHWPLNGHRAQLEELVSELVKHAMGAYEVEPSLVTLRLKRTAGTVRGEVSDRRTFNEGTAQLPDVRAGRRTTVWFELPLD
jgi:hypothetical protein